MRFLEVPGLGQVSRVGLPVVVWNRERASGRRLQLRRIPLYQVHQPNPVVPDSVTMTGMRSLPQVVVIRGASSVGQLELNVAAADLDLDTESQAALTQAARAFTPISAVRTLLDAVKTRSRS